MSRSRNYCFTYNNYPNTTIVDEVECSYIIYGREIGASGTPHLQGFVRFENVKTLKAVIKLLPGCHLEVSRAPEASIEYCKKDGDITERGTKPVFSKEKGQAEKRRWRDIRVAAEEGRFDDIPEDIRFKNHQLIKVHRTDALRARSLVDTTDKMLWYYGASGTGKSRKAREDNPNAYLKMCNKWWDGYQDEEVVIIEDFDVCHSMLGHHLKIWADRYSFPVEVKGGSFTIRPRLIIVTSNYHPRDIWQDTKTYDPIMRRFNCIEFKALSSPPPTRITNQLNPPII